MAAQNTAHTWTMRNITRERDTHIKSTHKTI